MCTVRVCRGCVKGREGCARVCNGTGREGVQGATSVTGRQTDKTDRKTTGRKGAHRLGVAEVLHSEVEVAYLHHGGGHQHEEEHVEHRRPEGYLGAAAEP